MKDGPCEQEDMSQHLKGAGRAPRVEPCGTLHSTCGRHLVRLGLHPGQSRGPGWERGWQL